MKEFKLDSVCRKCGCKETAKIAYYPKQTNILTSNVIDEGIERTCPRCGYLWAEIPLTLGEG